jgi:hypothetical protein
MPQHKGIVSSGTTQKYVEHLEASIARHRLIERLEILNQMHKSKQKFQRALNKLDKESKQLMANDKKMQTDQVRKNPILSESSFMD